MMTSPAARASGSVIAQLRAIVHAAPEGIYRSLTIRDWATTCTLLEMIERSEA
jgi:hypothetical protein